jgi:hypothetical protein
LIATSLREDIAIQIDTWSDFNDGQSFRLQPEDATLRDVQHILSKLSRSSPAEGQVFDFRNKLLVLSLLRDPQSPVFEAQIEATSREVPAKENRAGVSNNGRQTLRNRPSRVDEAPA